MSADLLLGKQISACFYYTRAGPLLSVCGYGITCCGQQSIASVCTWQGYATSLESTSTMMNGMQVEEPTVRMTFLVNTSAFAGKEGKFVTSRNLKERLERELERNLALRVEPGESADQFIVSGRGSLHISILMENMRREGYEFAVGPPTVSCFHLLYSACILW